MRAGGLLVLMSLVIWGCPAEEVVLHRSNCLVCHQPLDETGVARGIEEAHPWAPLTCEGCHGGQPYVCDGTMGETAAGNPTCDGEWVYSMEEAHVSPGDGPVYLKNLSSTALDAVNPDYLQFINPGDLRVADRACGECHGEAVEAVKRSTMAHTSGEITVARYRGGLQSHPHGIYGGAAVVDFNPDPDNACGVAELELYDPEPFDPETSPGGVPSVAEAQEQYMVKSCMRCHLNDFGENRFPGDFRSSG
ncbi:MAG: hypothetical protein VX938_02075, partial [Myxococcota bacterium]|nr:hypothetical protein [Myxococcota bacterium]